MNHDRFFYEALDPESEQIFNETFPSNNGKNCVCVKFDGFVFFESFKNLAVKIRNMQIRDDDVWVCSFPKTGTTWVQEMVWCIKNGLNHKDVQNLINDRFPFLEFRLGRENSFEKIKQMPSPRFIKTHVPFNLLPKNLQNFSTNAKIIYIMRNPRDTLISYYHHAKLLMNFKGTFTQFAELFFKGTVPCGPFPAHLKGYLAHKSNPKILLLTYEEMKKDLKQVIEKTSIFLGKTLSETEIQELLDHLSFSSMKQNRAVNHQPIIEMKKKLKLIDDNDGQFMRCGIVGDWKDKLDGELCQRFEEWEKCHLNDIDLIFSI